jgi:thiamine pyrophosphokinase
VAHKNEEKPVRLHCNIYQVPGGQNPHNTLASTRLLSWMRVRVGLQKTQNIYQNVLCVSARINQRRHRAYETIGMTRSSVVRVTANFLNPWRACEDLHKDERQNDAVILLNYDLPPNALSLWMSCSYRVCADGGANRVQDLWVEYKRGLSELECTGRDLFKHPHRIVGDMDSVETSVATMYRENKELGCFVDDESENQDSTDFTKCLEAIVKHKPEIKRVFTLGALGGRLDHVLYNMKVLFDYPNLEIILIGDDSTAQAIPAGKTVIKCESEYEKMWCGLVPLQGDARVSTTGLKWNLDGDIMSFNAGGLISTSNQFVSDEVVVHTDAPLLFTFSCISTSNRAARTVT